MIYFLYLEVISSFFKEKPYLEWSILSCLQYSSERANMGTDDIESTFEFMKNKLKSISNQKNILVRAQQKASSIYSTFDKTIERPEIQNVFQTMIKKSEVESRKQLYKETMKVENINDKMAVAPDTRLTEELTTQTEVETDEDDSEGDDEKDHFNFQTGKTDYDDELNDGEKSPVIMAVERREGRSSSTLHIIPFLVMK